MRRQTLLFYWLTDTHGGKTGPKGKGVWKRSTKPGIKWYMYMLWQLRWCCKVSLGAYAYTVSPSRKQGYLFETVEKEENPAAEKRQKKGDDV